MILDFSMFLIYAFKAVNFPLSTVFTVFHKFWQVAFSFSFASEYFKNLSWIFFDQCVIRSVLVHFQICVRFSSYLSIIDFWFNSTVIWENTFYCLYPFKLFGCVFCTECGVFLVNVLCKLETNVCFAVVEWNFLPCQLDPVNWWF